MDAAPHPAREILYGSIRNIGRYRIEGLLAAGRGAEAIDMILGGARDGIGRLGGDKNSNTAQMLVALLHYMLTLALIPSQRKVMHHTGVGIDVVIPDLATLDDRPAGALIICIPELHEEDAEVQARRLEAIQPHRGNIWHVTEARSGEGTYSIRYNTFHGIIDDIFRFLPPSGAGRLRLFGAGP